MCKNMFFKQISKNVFAGNCHVFGTYDCRDFPLQPVESAAGTLSETDYNFLFKNHGRNKYQAKKNKLKCKFSFYSDFILQQKLCKAFRRHFPHIRAIFKTLCMASATKYSFKNINNLVMLVHARL